MVEWADFTVGVFWGQDFEADSLTADLGGSVAVSFPADLGDSAAVSFQGTASSSALTFPVTGLITARDRVILITDTATILTRLPHILTITRTQMIIHTQIQIPTHMFIPTHTRMFIHHVKAGSTRCKKGPYFDSRDKRQYSAFHSEHRIAL